jgi:hypothetical protein
MSGKDFTPTSNIRNTTMSKEAVDFAAHLKRCERAILDMKTSAETILTTTRNVMAAPLPVVFEDTAAAAGGAARPMASIGGAAFAGDAVTRLSQTASAQLQAQVLVPVRRWLEVHAALQARLKEVEALRLEVDSRRHTVIALAASVDKQRAALGAGGANGRLENSLEDTVKRLQHKEAKLALVAHKYQESEQALADDLGTLIKDAEWLRHYMATALRLQGEALMGAAAALGDVKPAHTASLSMSELSLGSGATAAAPAGVRTSMQAGLPTPGSSVDAASAAAPNPFLSSGVLDTN